MNAEIGIRIRALRKALNISQEQLAEILDISASYLGLVERGGRRFRLPKLIMLSEVFNVTLDFLIKGQGAEKTTRNESDCPVLNTIVREIALFNLSAPEMDLLLQAVKLQMSIIVQARVLGKKGV